MGTESPKRNALALALALALGNSLPIASFFRVAETKTLFGLRFGPPLAMAQESLSLECFQDLPRDEEVENRLSCRFHNFGDSALICLFVETFVDFVLPVITRR